MIYDVVVVGSGPAGAIVAYELAKQGFKVLILDKAKLPRYKPCGGGITYKTIKEFPYEIQPAIDLKSEGIILSFGGKQHLKTDLQKNVAWMVMRDQFDYYLVQKAIEAGVRVKDSTRVSDVNLREGDVKIITDRGHFHSQIVVGADGVNSTVARSLHLLTNRETGVALEAEVCVPSVSLRKQGAYATFDFGALPNGYGWIFPKKDHLSIGIFHAKKEKLSSIKLYFQRFIESQNVLARHRLMNICGHRIPLGGKTGKLHTHRAILVGDAANLADPWLGEGIYYAVSSAKIAANVIKESLDDDIERLFEYSQIIFRRIGKQYIQARNLANLTYKYPKFCLYLLQNDPNLQEVVFGTICGDYNFKKVNRYLLKQFPRITFLALHHRGLQK